MKMQAFKGGSHAIDPSCPATSNTKHDGPAPPLSDFSLGTPSKTILRLPSVKKKTGLSRSSIYAAMKLGSFPASIRLSSRCVGWVEEDINLWIQTRMEASHV